MSYATQVGPERTTGPHPTYPPSDWYTSPELLELERRRVFDHSWSLVGTLDELGEPGAYLTATVGTGPILVVRDNAGNLRAFHNLCRHRGLPVLQGQGNCGGFLTCPYHQWSYDVEGRLRRVPQMQRQFEGIDLSDWGLLQAAADTWHGMVFVNPDPTASPLREALGELADRLDPFLSGPLVEIARLTYTAKCNWKLIVENHIDVYHLWHLHRHSLSMYDHQAFEWDMKSNNWWSYEPLKDPEDAPSQPFNWLTEYEREGIGAHLFFPNLMLVTTGSYFASYDATPTAPDETLLTLRIWSGADSDPEALLQSVRSFMAEDVDVCELLQEGAGSSQFTTGPLAATHEAPIREFHRALAALCRD